MILWAIIGFISTAAFFYFAGVACGFAWCSWVVNKTEEAAHEQDVSKFHFERGDRTGEGEGRGQAQSPEHETDFRFPSGRLDG